jgi:FkbM family methyltransferase
VKPPLVRLFAATARIAILALAVLALLMFLAPRYDWAWGMRARVVASVYRPFRFPALANDRDGQCTLGDAWREAVPGRAINARKIEREMRQVASDGGLIQVETAAGRMWIPSSDRMAYAEELAEEGEEEYGIQTGVRAGDVVLDCGANVGSFTQEALRHGAGRVVAIEPAPWALECLRRNFPEEIKSGKVVVYPKGVWDKEDTLELNVPPGMASTAATVALTRVKGVTVSVGLTTIDRMVAELGLDRVDFIKMDIEGAEPNALRGSVQTVERFHPRMVISLEHRPTDPETISTLTRNLWPTYSIKRGPCTNMNEHLQPVVMFAKFPAGGEAR